MSYEQYANNAQNTTAGAINNSSNPVTFTMTGVTNFPTVPQFRILIDSELMLVTGVSGTSFTASRAQEGTSIASHSSGATVTHVLTAGALQQYNADRELVGVFASIPTAGVLGRRYTCTDVPYMAIDTGSAWQYWYEGVPVTLPAASGWTWINQGSHATVTQNGSILLENLTGNGSNNAINGYYRAVPGSTPYTLTWAFKWYNQLVAGTSFNYLYNAGGPMLVNSGATSALLWRIGVSQGGTMGVWYDYFSTTTSASEISPFNTTGNNYSSILGQPTWMTLVDDGTHRNWYLGVSANNPILLFQESRTANITAAYYGIGLNAYNTGECGVELINMVGP